MRSLKALSVLLLFAFFPGAAVAQDKAFTLNVNVDLVELHVSVIDEKDLTVSGLKKENFEISENGVTQPISVFKHEDIPVSLGLVIDNSRSIEPRKLRLDAGAIAFVRKGNPEDETFVVHFDDAARISRDFTANIADLEKTLAATKPYGQTAIYDALNLALDKIEEGQHEKKAILLITDGIDNVSKKSLEETIERVKRSRVLVYTMGVLSVSGGDEAETSLIQLAEASGGRAYFPDDVDQASSMMEKIARDLREQYTLGYFPSNPVRNGAWRTVRVAITPPLDYTAKLKAEYRRGYYGPKD